MGAIASQPFNITMMSTSGILLVIGSIFWAISGGTADPRTKSDNLRNATICFALSIGLLGIGYSLLYAFKYADADVLLEGLPVEIVAGSQKFLLAQSYNKLQTASIDKQVGKQFFTN